MAETMILGIVGIKNMGDYNSQTQYEKLNVVTYQGSSYCALKSSMGVLPTNTDYWQLYAEKGGPGEQGPKPVKGEDYWTDGDKEEIESDLQPIITSNVQSEVTEQLSGLASATPTVVSSTSEMVDTTKIYVSLSDGKWYYYNGTRWTAGGDYVGDVDAFVKKDGIGEVAPRNIKSSKYSYHISNNIFPNIPLYKEHTYVYISNGALAEASSANINCYRYKVDEMPNRLYFRNNNAGAQVRFIVFTEDDMTTVIGNQLESQNMIDIPETAKYIYLSINETTYPSFEIYEYTYNYKLADELKIDEKNIIEDVTSGLNNSNNMFSKAELVAENKYVGTSTISGNIVLNDSNTHNTYRLKVKKGDVISSLYLSYSCLVHFDNLRWITQVVENATSTNVTNDGYFYFSILKSRILDVFVGINRGYNLSNETFDKKYSIDKFREHNMIDSNAFVNIYNSVADNYIITAKMKFETFANTYIRWIKANNDIVNYIKVTSTNIEINAYYTDPVITPHGLTIANDLTIKFEKHNGKANITLISNGEIFKLENIDFYVLTNEPTRALLYFTSATYISGELNVIFKNIDKDLWLIGDSYMGLSNPARWCYYLTQNNENDNVFINSAPGASSNNAYVCLQNLLKIARPKKVLIATGMNDGTDNGTISSLYKTNLDNMIELLKSYEIEPILATIPSVPNINHEYKNAYVRSLNYRYVDFASAVGANSSGVWFNGMLSSDNVHPTEKGAKALYAEAIVDLPELLY